jgi:hypothetical protein
MLYVIYIAIALLILLLVVRELFLERQWRNQIALAMIIIPLVLRILQVK